MYVWRPTMQAEPLLLPRQWSGDAAGTTGNIKLMAECIARERLKNGKKFTKDNVVGIYFDGVGLAGTPDLVGFIEYIQNGATANDIRDRCVEAYRFIVEHCTEESEVWLLGFSRGAFTVRSVAGMINNFGILDKKKFELTPLIDGARAKPDPICAEVYRMYRSRDEQFHPDEKYPIDFKRDYCLNLGTRPAIRFMGLLDTVGSLGVPTINAGYGLEFLFYDQVVSKQVKNVYHALAAHDVFFGFDPCFVRRQDGYSKNHLTEGDTEGVTLEVWFPGAHWDLGRQRFVPFRTTGAWWERVLHGISSVCNLLGININPDLDCSVKPLTWMLRCMRQTDGGLLDDNNIFFDEAVQRCEKPLPRNRIPFLPQALTKNALESLNKRFLCCLAPLSARLALRDRQIPEYSPANFIGEGVKEGDDKEDAFSYPKSGFKSRAFNTFKAMRGDIRWVFYGQPGDAAPPLGAPPSEAPKCSCKCCCSECAARI